MESIYEEVCKMEKSRIGELQDSIRKAYETAEHSFLYVWMMKKENSFRSLPLSVISVLMCM